MRVKKPYSKTGHFLRGAHAPQSQIEKVVNPVFLVPVVQKVDNALHWISLCTVNSTINVLLVSLILIHWIVSDLSCG